MSNKVNNPNVYPISEQDYNKYSEDLPPYSGMTLRDHFAGLALQGHLASEYYVGHNNQEGAEGIAKTMYMFADAMLLERQKPTNT